MIIEIHIDDEDVKQFVLDRVMSSLTVDKTLRAATGRVVDVAAECHPDNAQDGDANHG